MRYAIPGHTHDEVILRFGSLPWHDSELVGLCVQHNSDDEPSGDDLILSVKFRIGTDPALVDARVVLENCSFLVLNMDLYAKRWSSDQIYDGQCAYHSKLQLELAKPIHGDRLLNDLHFYVSMVPPFGEINAFARGFSVTSSREGHSVLREE